MRFPPPRPTHDAAVCARRSAPLAGPTPTRRPLDTGAARPDPAQAAGRTPSGHPLNPAASRAGPANPETPASPPLLTRVRATIRARHYSPRTEASYVAWIRRFILFHHTRHPATMGAAEVSRFLSALAEDRHVSASTQNQALAALLFLYRHVLNTPLSSLENVVRAKRSQHLPVVLTRTEVGGILRHVNGPVRLMAWLMYGAGLRLLECAQLRVKDVDFAMNQILVRGGKGDKDRVTVLPGRASRLTPAS